MYPGSFSRPLYREQQRGPLQHIPSRAGHGLSKMTRAYSTIIGVLVFVAQASAQDGSVAIYDGTSTLGAFGTPWLLFADYMGTQDICVSIHNAISALPSAGGTVDARGFKGTLTCASNPFVPGKPVKLLLGAYTITTSVQWLLPTGMRVEGSGPGATVIQATSPFPGAAVLAFAQPATTAAGIQDLTVYCSGSATIGIQNQYGMERTTVDRVAIQNCSDTGLEVTTSGAAHSGPYRDISVMPPTGAVSSTTCARIGTPLAGCGPNGAACTCTAGSCLVPGFWGVQGFSCTAQTTAPINVGLDIAVQGGSIEDVDVGNAAVGLQIETSSSGLTVNSVHGTVGTAVVQLGTSNAPSPNFDVSLRGLSLDSGSGLVIQDYVNGYNSGTGPVVLYVIGTLSPITNSRTIFRVP
jgi:hypothetical protein